MRKALESSSTQGTPVALQPRSALTLVNAKRNLSFEQYDCLIGISQHIASLKEFISLQASYNRPTLLIGERGLRQEQIARALHQAGPNWAQPFFAVNVHGLDTESLNTLLFGSHGQHHQSGQAGQLNQVGQLGQSGQLGQLGQLGMIETCDRGTIYINDLTQLPPLLQQRFAVHIEGYLWRNQSSGGRGGAYSAPGSGESRGPRLIFATEWNPAEMRAENRIGYSLVELLRSTSFTIKPLRERSEDIPYLVNHLVARLVKRLNKGPHEITEGAMKVLADYLWEGNIDELETALESAITSTPPRQIDESLLPARIRHSSLKSIPSTGIDLAQIVDDFERTLIETALRQTANNQTKASSLLGLRVQTLNMKLKRFKEREEPETGLEAGPETEL